MRQVYKQLAQTAREGERTGTNLAGRLKVCGISECFTSDYFIFNYKAGSYRSVPSSVLYTCGNQQHLRSDIHDQRKRGYFSFNVIYCDNCNLFCC
ncbi:hypothetical protein FGO68_gene17459 [Halteria grandinella]|uniref:Uncharacterized protein n=1 Tax=Halteria grandinella TaxID=5974 RepID=A0A8J8ND11_HALGN|nr:hypothetical protein FGO68_gene17459 [Halteria grandinella]